MTTYPISINAKLSIAVHSAYLAAVELAPADCVVEVRSVEYIYPGSTTHQVQADNYSSNLLMSCVNNPASVPSESPLRCTQVSFPTCIERSSLLFSTRRRAFSTLPRFDEVLEVVVPVPVAPCEGQSSINFFNKNQTGNYGDRVRSNSRIVLEVWVSGFFCGQALFPFPLWPSSQKSYVRLMLLPRRCGSGDDAVPLPVDDQTLIELGIDDFGYIDISYSTSLLPIGGGYPPFLCGLRKNLPCDFPVFLSLSASLLLNSLKAANCDVPLPSFFAHTYPLSAQDSLNLDTTALGVSLPVRGCEPAFIQLFSPASSLVISCAPNTNVDKEIEKNCNPAEFAVVSACPPVSLQPFFADFLSKTLHVCMPLDKIPGIDGQALLVLHLTLLSPAGLDQTAVLAANIKLLDAARKNAVVLGKGNFGEQINSSSSYSVGVLPACRPSPTGRLIGWVNDEHRRRALARRRRKCAIVVARLTATDVIELARVARSITCGQADEDETLLLREGSSAAELCSLRSIFCSCDDGYVDLSAQPSPSIPRFASSLLQLVIAAASHALPICAALRLAFAAVSSVSEMIHFTDIIFIVDAVLAPFTLDISLEALVGLISEALLLENVSHPQPQTRSEPLISQLQEQQQSFANCTEAGANFSYEDFEKLLVQNPAFWHSLGVPLACEKILLKPEYDLPSSLAGLCAPLVFDSTTKPPEASRYRPALQPRPPNLCEKPQKLRETIKLLVSLRKSNADDPSSSSFTHVLSTSLSIRDAMTALESLCSIPASRQQWFVGGAAVTKSLAASIGELFTKGHQQVGVGSLTIVERAPTLTIVLRFRLRTSHHRWEVNVPVGSKVLKLRSIAQQRTLVPMSRLLLFTSTGELMLDRRDISWYSICDGDVVDIKDENQIMQKNEKKKVKVAVK